VPELPQSRSEVPARSRERPPSITTGPPSATVMAARGTQGPEGVGHVGAVGEPLDVGAALGEGAEDE